MQAQKSILVHKLMWVLIPYQLIGFFIVIVDFIQHPTTVGPFAAFGGAIWFKVYALLVVPFYLAIGYLVVRRSPNNLIALMMINFGLGVAGWGVSVDLSPAYFNILLVPVNILWTILIFLTFYFPDGRVFPRRLSPYLTLFLYSSVALGVLGVISAPTIPNLNGNPVNPWYVPGFAELYNGLVNLYFIGLVPILPLVFISPYLRYRRADAYQRQQLKWLMLFGGMFVPYLVMYFGTGFLQQWTGQFPTWIIPVYNVYIAYFLVFPALAIGNAILRHRLYDIDIIIRRTLIYSILSAILAVVFFGGVTVTQAILHGATGQSSDVAVVISTLGIAALFTPLRRRVQATIDRRFYRTKYDAQKTLEQFSAVMRDEVDAEKLKAALVATIQETMQPKQIALWINEPQHPKPKIS